MDDSQFNEDELRRYAKAGDIGVITELFDRHRSRLRRMVEMRLDIRLASRLDPSDVLQDAFVDVLRNCHELADSDLPVFLWFRLKVGHRLADLHRFHLGAQKRSVRREISIFRGPTPQASSISLANHLVGRITSVSNAAVRAELSLLLQDVLNDMDDIDREVLMLRHFEELSNLETSRVLEISENAASNRYVRALRRLKEAIDKSSLRPTDHELE